MSMPRPSSKPFARVLQHPAESRGYCAVRPNVEFSTVFSRMHIQELDVQLCRRIPLSAL